MEPKKEKHVMGLGQRAGRKNGWKRYISKAYSVPGMETRDTQDVGTEAEQGAGRQMEVVFTGGSDTGVGGECYQPGALELQVGQGLAMLWSKAPVCTADLDPALGRKSSSETQES